MTRRGSTALGGLAVLVALAGAGAGAADDDALRPDAEAARAAPEHQGDDAAADTAEDPDEVEAELAEIGETLRAIAAALAASDPGALRPHLDDPDGPVGQRWLERAGNTAGVPFDDYVLRVDGRLGDLTTERVRQRHDRHVRVVAVVEEHAFAGQDAEGPARHRHTLALVREEDGWLLLDDRAGRRLGRSEPAHLWDLGPVATTEQGSVLALHHPEATGVSTLVTETAAALDVLRDRWPGAWSETVTLLVPRDQDELTHLVDVPFELDDFLAFTSATSLWAPGRHELTGTRLIVNPGRIPDRADLRERVLLHELLHVATRPVASAQMPLWLEEGVAQALGEQGPSTGHTRQLDAAGPTGRRLPTDHEFTAHGREATQLAYQRAWSFVDHLVDRFGPDAVAGFYRSVGEAATSPGTVRHHLDRAARAELGDDLDALAAAWRAAG